MNEWINDQSVNQSWRHTDLPIDQFSVSFFFFLISQTQKLIPYLESVSTESDLTLEPRPGTPCFLSASPANVCPSVAQTLTVCAGGASVFLPFPKNWEVHLCFCLFLRRNYMNEKLIPGPVLGNIQTELKDFQISCRYFSKLISCPVADFESLFLVKGQKRTKESKLFHSHFWRIPERKGNCCRGKTKQAVEARSDWV